MAAETQELPESYPRSTQGIPKGYPRDQQARNTGATPEQHRINTLATRSALQGFLGEAALRQLVRESCISCTSCMGYMACGEPFRPKSSPKESKARLCSIESKNSVFVPT